MHTGRPFQILACELEGDGQGARAGLPVKFASEVDFCVGDFGRLDGHDQVEVMRIKGLAKIGRDGDDGTELDVGIIHVDLGRFEETDCMGEVSRDDIWGGTVLGQGQDIFFETISSSACHVSGRLTFLEI